MTLTLFVAAGTTLQPSQTRSHTSRLRPLTMSNTHVHSPSTNMRTGRTDMQHDIHLGATAIASRRAHTIHVITIHPTHNHGALHTCRRRHWHGTPTPTSPLAHRAHLLTAHLIQHDTTPRTSTTWTTTTTLPFDIYTMPPQQSVTEHISARTAPTMHRTSRTVLQHRPTSMHHMHHN